jgi:arabinose-5-phosphate isomerase
MDAELRQLARQVIDVEARAVAAMAEAVDDAFERAVELVLNCRGALLATGVGKAGHVARKVSATFASTGTPSHFLSATDAVHGDLGAVRPGDVVLVFSASGESDEIVRLLSLLKKLDHPVIGITASRENSLGRHADVALCIGRIEEACPLRLAPTASTTAMLALADALAMCVMKKRNFTADDFATFHPAGQLGRKLIRVREAMTFRAGENLPLGEASQTVGAVLAGVSRIKRRSGGIILVDAAGKLAGFFSDGDLRRLVERDPRGAMETPVATVMSHDPKRVRDEALASEAMAIMRQYRIDELPVVDAAGKPVGLIDVQDLVLLKMYDVT